MKCKVDPNVPTSVEKELGSTNITTSRNILLMNAAEGERPRALEVTVVLILIDISMARPGS